MKEAFAQRKQDWLIPISIEDLGKIREFPENKILRLKIHGVLKPRSLKQLNTYWAACGFIADNTEHKQWNTKNKVDFQCRVGTHFVDPDLVIVKKDGSVQFSYRSIAFKNLPHIQACNYFDNAFGIMLDFWNATHKDKITSDELVELVKKAMQSQ